MSHFSSHKATEHGLQQDTESSMEREHSPKPSNLAHEILALQRTAGNQAVTHLLQTAQHSSSVGAPVKGVPTIVNNVLRSPGQPLDVAIRAFMEPRFGYDFNRVRVHTDEQAAESARAVNAQAYTVGRDVVFGAGRYAPKTSEGKRLMAHELTHLVQQGSSQTVAPQAKLEINRSGDLSEKEADEVSSQVISSAHPLMQRHFVTPSSLLQRQEASTSVNPPLASVDPGIAKVPWIRYVDLFDQVVYDLSYRRKGGSSSTWLKVYYPDGAIIDINIDDIIEESMTSENARNAMAQGHIGIGGRIFPQVMNPRTTPRLWKAKQEAFEIMDEETRELIQLALPAVMFVITVSMSTIRGPEPSEELPLRSKRSRVPAQSGGSTASVKGEGESAPPTTSKGGGGVKQVSPEGTEATPESVWVQLRDGRVREYLPSEVKGDLAHGAEVSTVEGKGIVVSRGEPPHSSQVFHHAEPPEPATVVKQPTPRELAAERGSVLLKTFKEEGVGTGAGRSGGHGTPHQRAGAALIREANLLPKNDPMREALKIEGERLILQGTSHSHR